MKRVIWVDIGIAGINLCFLTLYGILIANDRLAVDDFHFLAILKEHGVFGGVAFEYGDWSTRWPSTFLTNIFLLLHEVTGYGLILHGVLGLGVFVSAINLFMRGFFSRVLAWTDKGSGGKGRSLYASDDGDFVLTFLLYRSEGPRWLLWNLSIFLAAVVFLTTIRIDETWFWLCASCTYLWGMIMLVLGAACLIHPNRDRIMTILACLAFLYVGGASGPLALFVLFLMVSVILGAWLKRGTGMLSLNDPFRRRIYPAFIACLVGFIILYMGEGNRAREAFFEDIGVGEALILNVKMTGIVLLKRVPQKLPLMIAASVPMVLVGGTLNKGFSSSVLTRGVFWGVVLYGLLIFIYQLPVTYKTQDVAAYRTLFPVTFLSLAFCAFLFFMIGAWLQPVEKVRWLLLAVPFLVIGSVLIFQLVHQSRVTSAYAEAYDQRMERIDEHRGRSSPLALEPLPPSGMLYRAYIRKDTAHFSNRHMKKGLGLNFPITLE